MEDIHPSVVARSSLAQPDFGTMACLLWDSIQQSRSISVHKNIANTPCDSASKEECLTNKVTPHQVVEKTCLTKNVESNHENKKSKSKHSTSAKRFIASNYTLRKNSEQRGRGSKSPVPNLEAVRLDLQGTTNLGTASMLDHRKLFCDDSKIVRESCANHMDDVFLSSSPCSDRSLPSTPTIRTWLDTYRSSIGGNLSPITSISGHCPVSSPFDFTSVCAHLDSYLISEHSEDNQDIELTSDKCVKKDIETVADPGNNIISHVTQACKKECYDLGWGRQDVPLESLSNSDIIPDTLEPRRVHGDAHIKTGYELRNDIRGAIASTTSFFTERICQPVDANVGTCVRWSKSLPSILMENIVDQQSRNTRSRDEFCHLRDVGIENRSGHSKKLQHEYQADGTVPTSDESPVRSEPHAMSSKHKEFALQEKHSAHSENESRGCQGHHKTPLLKESRITVHESVELQISRAIPLELESQTNHEHKATPAGHVSSVCLEGHDNPSDQRYADYLKHGLMHFNNEILVCQEQNAIPSEFQGCRDHRKAAELQCQQSNLHHSEFNFQMCQEHKSVPSGLHSQLCRENQEMSTENESVECLEHNAMQSVYGGRGCRGDRKRTPEQALSGHQGDHLTQLGPESDAFHNDQKTSSELGNNVRQVQHDLSSDLSPMLQDRQGFPLAPAEYPVSRAHQSRTSEEPDLLPQDNFSTSVHESLGFEEHPGMTSEHTYQSYQGHHTVPSKFESQMLHENDRALPENVSSVCQYHDEILSEYVPRSCPSLGETPLESSSTMYMSGSPRKKSSSLLPELVSPTTSPVHLQESREQISNTSILRITNTDHTHQTSPHNRDRGRSPTIDLNGRVVESFTSLALDEIIRHNSQACSADRIVCQSSEENATSRASSSSHEKDCEIGISRSSTNYNPPGTPYARPSGHNQLLEGHDTEAKETGNVPITDTDESTCAIKYCIRNSYQDGSSNPSYLLGRCFFPPPFPRRRTLYQKSQHLKRIHVLAKPQERKKSSPYVSSSLRKAPKPVLSLARLIFERGDTSTTMKERVEYDNVKKAMTHHPENSRTVEDKKSVLKGNALKMHLDANSYVVDALEKSNFSSLAQMIDVRASVLSRLRTDQRKHGSIRRLEARLFPPSSCSPRKETGCEITEIEKNKRITTSKQPISTLKPLNNHHCLFSRKFTSYSRGLQAFSYQNYLEDSLNISHVPITQFPFRERRFCSQRERYQTRNPFPLAPTVGRDFFPTLHPDTPSIMEGHGAAMSGRV